MRRRNDEQGNDHESKCGIRCYEDSWREIVEDKPVDPVAYEIARMASDTARGAQSIFEYREGTRDAQKRLGAHQRDRYQMRSAQPKAPYPSPSPHDSDDDQQKANDHERNVARVNDRHAVCQQAVPEQH